MTRLFLALALMAPAALAHDDEDASDNGTAWVLVRDDRTVSMHGSMKDLKLARRHLRELGPGYLWFRRDGKQYVLKDGKAVAQIEDAARPQEDLGSEQSRLGQRQSELGQEQARLGHKQAELGHKQAETALRRAHRELNGNRPEAVDRETEQELEETQRELSRAEETLGREQEKLGREQEKMGSQQQKMSQEVERKVEALIVSSLRDGTAKLVHD
jgi:bla regulator protein BlaR1